MKEGAEMNTAAGFGAENGRPNAEKPLRVIATEEAFAIPEQLDAMRKLVAESSEYDPDLHIWQHVLKGGVLHDRLLDLDDERIRIMDQAGIDMQVLSLTSTGVQMFEPDQAVEIASIANDRLAEAIARHPTRFAGLATVAPQDPARAVKEMERAVTRLKLNGVVINSHTNGEYLSERKYWPILEAAAELGAPIYIHPRAPGPNHAAAYRTDHLEHAIWGYHAEAGLHGLRLITGGVFDQFPKLKIVLGHMGEGIPHWFYRIDYVHTATANRGERPKLKQKPSDYFKQNFVITTSGVNWTPPWELCISALGADKIMFAVDYPYQETMEAVRFLRSAPISEENRAKIAYENAVRVFGIKRF
jgi:predicted TIM-barrel fold metal-dependent hydrolase